MVSDYLFASADEAELSLVLAGRPVLSGMQWRNGRSGSAVPAGAVGVLWREADSPDDPIRPVAVIVRKEDQRRLFSRFAQLRSDLSPISSWCHVLTPQQLERMDGLVRTADPGPLAAAWTGLVVAEASLLSDRPVTKIMAPACLATRTFAIARTAFVWDGDRIGEVNDSFDLAHGLTRPVGQSSLRLRSVLEPIWSVLSGVDRPIKATGDRRLEPIREAVSALVDVRISHERDEGELLGSIFSSVAEEGMLLGKLPAMSPEDRVRLYDALVSSLDQRPKGNLDARSSVLCFIAGYLATVAAGGAASLPLLQATNPEWPEIGAWAYVVGSLGERVVWTSAFDGLARLVSRELLRPFRLDDPPLCDFSIDEAQVTADRHLSDPLVHLRIKQSRIVSVALSPGVNSLVSLADANVGERREVAPRREPERQASYAPRTEALQVLADALWPYLRSRMDPPSARERNYSDQYRPARPKSGRRSPQPDLPLKRPDEKDE